MNQSLVFLAITAAVAVLLGTAGCDRKPAPGKAAEPKSAEGSGARSVQVAAAQRAFLTIEAVAVGQAGETLLLPGRVAFRPQAQSAVGAAVTGRVSGVLVRAGEAVKAGAALLTIDSADASAARAALDQAATRLASAESTFKRQVEMFEKGVGLEFERLEAEAKLKEARAEHERARQAAGLIGSGQGVRYTVRAPSDGVVMAIRVAVGATVVQGGEALLELGDPSRLQVVAQAPEGELRRIAVGQEADVELPALAARVSAKVENFSPRVDPDSRRAPLYLALTGKMDGVRAGMLAQVVLKVAAEGGLSVPVTAVLIKDGKRRVVYVERPDGGFEARDVQTGRDRDGQVVILSGLKPGERIVARGALLLDTQAEQLL